MKPKLPFENYNIHNDQFHPPEPNLEGSLLKKFPMETFSESMGILLKIPLKVLIRL